MAMKRCYVCGEYSNAEQLKKFGDAYRHADCDGFIPRTTLEFKMENEMIVFFKRNPGFREQLAKERSVRK